MTNTRASPMSWQVPTVAPERVIFFSGAGISADPPTDGPIGSELTRRALDYAFLGETVDELREIYAAVMPPSESRELPRLEAVLEIAVQVHGTAALEVVLADLADAAPNPLHRFFGDHLRRGGQHITANFDTLIERTAADVRPLHFHGALDGGPQSFEHLGARLSRLERGFDPEMRRRLTDVLLSIAGPTIVFVGYSGLDYFDVDPFIASIAGELAAVDAHVVWMTHDPSAARGRLTVHGAEVAGGGPPMVRMLRGAGVRVTTVSGATLTLLDSFARQWGMPALRREHSRATWLASASAARPSSRSDPAPLSAHGYVPRA